MNDTEHQHSLRSLAAAMAAQRVGYQQAAMDVAAALARLEALAGRWAEYGCGCRPFCGEACLVRSEVSGEFADELRAALDAPLAGEVV